MALGAVVKLTDGFFAKLFRRARQGVETVIDVPVSEAEGVIFECPRCTKGAGHSAHAIRCWFADRNLPADLEPKPRWRASGTSIDDLTLTPSILLPGPDKDHCGWHGFVRNGHTVDA